MRDFIGKVAISLLIVIIIPQLFIIVMLLAAFAAVKDIWREPDDKDFWQ